MLLLRKSIKYRSEHKEALKLSGFGIPPPHIVEKKLIVVQLIVVVDCCLSIYNEPVCVCVLFYQPTKRS